MEYYPEYSENDFRLYHHGILGMKWGKKNGPPYPLGASDHSASERKAGWRKSLAEGRADRAKNEAKTGHKIADAYTSAMDKKAEKRRSQANKSGSIKDLNRAAEASREASVAKNIANRYKSAMDKKADSRAKAAEKEYVEQRIKKTEQRLLEKERVQQQKLIKKRIDRTWYNTYNKAASAMNSRIGAINDKHPNANLDDLNSKETKAYLKEVSDTWKKCYDDAIKSDYGDSLRVLDMDASANFPLYNFDYG